MVKVDVWISLGIRNRVDFKGGLRTGGDGNKKNSKEARERVLWEINGTVEHFNSEVET